MHAKEASQQCDRIRNNGINSPPAVTRTGRLLHPNKLPLPQKWQIRDWVYPVRINLRLHAPKLLQQTGTQGPKKSCPHSWSKGALSPPAASFPQGVLDALLHWVAIPCVSNGWQIRIYKYHCPQQSSRNNRHYQRKTAAKHIRLRYKLQD